MSTNTQIVSTNVQENGYKYTSIIYGYTSIVYGYTSRGGDCLQKYKFVSTNLQVGEVSTNIQVVGSRTRIDLRGEAEGTVVVGGEPSAKPMGTGTSDRWDRWENML